MLKKANERGENERMILPAEWLAYTTYKHYTNVYATADAVPLLAAVLCCAEEDAMRERDEISKVRGEWAGRRRSRLELRL